MSAAAVPPAHLRGAREARSVLEQLRAETDRFSAQLRALEAHPGYRRLRSTNTTGATLRAWERAQAVTDEISVQLQACRATVDRAGSLLARRARVGRDDLALLTQVLLGPVDLPAQLAGAGDRLGMAALMAQMRAAHDEVLATVDTVETEYSALQAGLARLEQLLVVVRNRVEALAFRDDATADLVEGLDRELAEVRPVVLADPLGGVEGTDDESAGGQPGRLRRLGIAVDNALAYVTALSRQQGELISLIERLRQQVAEVETVEQQCRVAENEMRARILAPDPPDSAEYAGPALRRRLAQLDRQRLDGRWSRLSDLARDLDRGCAGALSAATARRAVAASLLDQRDELRGRLESYRAMAIGYGYAEDLDLADEYERSYQLLWSAPCDLDRAVAGVARYQQAVIQRTERDGQHGRTAG